jgi:pimeloyl-ACP methyl ester carboxylesterase
MELFYRAFEVQTSPEKPQNPIVIIHGLFGMSDNWISIGKHLSSNRSVIIPDMRNHGNSPHTDEFSLELMVDDLDKLIEKLDIQNPILLGHSMGGHVVMKYAFTYPDKVSKLIVADMSLRAAKLRAEHWIIFDALTSAPISEMNSIKEIETYFMKTVGNEKLVKFILKNIHPTPKGYQWKLNHQGLAKSFREKATKPVNEKDELYEGPTLFLKGGNSDYIRPEDHEEIYRHFPMTIMQTVDNAGHILHMEQAEQFLHLVKSFI